MEETIQLDGFGTLRRDRGYDTPWYVAGNDDASLKISPYEDGSTVFVQVHALGVTVTCVSSDAREAFGKILAALSRRAREVILSLGDAVVYA